MKNNRPDGDVWNLKDNDIKSQNYGKNFMFDFSYITSEGIKEVVKNYVWQNYRIRNKVLVGLYNEFGNLKHFNSFAKNKNITSFAELTNSDIDNFISFLHTTISDKSGKPLAYNSQKNTLNALKSIIHWCQLHKPNAVPDREIFTGNEYVGINRKLKIEFIPDDVLNTINEALKAEESPYVKYGIIILESTGMRIGDLRKLRIDCIKPHLISGHTITWFDYKNRKKRPPMPVRNECAVAVNKLIEATKELRDEADEKIKDMLFIDTIKSGNKYESRIGEIDVISSSTMKWWLKCFIRYNNIRNADGKLYNLTSHQFTRTLGTDMLSKGTNINVIQQVLGHTVPSTTKLFYADVKDKERAETFKSIGIIGNINQLNESTFDNVTEMEWFKANKDKCVAGLCDGYCTKHLQGGKICDRLLKRQKCYTCSRYITTPEFLEAHKNHLASLEKQVVEGEIYGEHYAEHFRPTIEVLKVIVERLEELQNGKN